MINCNEGTDGKSYASIEKAIQLAAIAHRGQKRKGTDIPYITHPFGVGVLLCRAGCPEEVVIAGILHDTIEDTTLTLAEIRGEFGERVASTVEACSEPDKSLPWEERKRHTLEFLNSAPNDVRFVALADKLNNVRAISSDYRENGEGFWERFNRGKEDHKWYYQGLVAALKDDSGDQAYQELHSQFAREVKAVFGDA